MTANQGSYLRGIADADIRDGEIAAEASRRPACPDSATDEVVLLDDFISPPCNGKLMLGDSDLRLIEALQAVLDARRTDNSIKMIKAQISDELDWE